MRCLIFFIILNALIVFNSGSNKVLATTIVVIVTSNSIALGADSKAVSIINGKEVYSTVCKIHNVDDYWFTLAGYSGNDKLNIVTEIQDKLARYKNIHDAIKILKPHLNNILKNQVHSHHDEFMKQLPSGTILTLAIVNSKNGLLTGYLLAVTVDWKTGEIHNSEKTLTTKENHGFFSAAGECTQMSLMPRKKEYTLTDMAHLINLEIASNPNSVGPPIDIVEVSPSGAVLHKDYK